MNDLFCDFAADILNLIVCANKKAYCGDSERNLHKRKSLNFKRK